jgi:hypothetical protein
MMQQVLDRLAVRGIFGGFSGMPRRAEGILGESS